MNFKHLASNVAIAFLSQFVAFLASAVTSFLVPKILGVEEYGYWQLFVFYASYVGFFALGAIDGIYLIRGGQSRDEVDRADVASQYWFSVGYVTLFSLIVGLVGGLLLFEGKRAEVIALTMLYSVVSHMACSLGTILQAMNETKAYSRSVMIDRGSFVLLIALPLFMRVDCFELYAALYVVAKVVCLVYCLWQVRDFRHVQFLPLPEASCGVLRSIRVGIKLTFANVASMLILGVARALIDYAWGIEAFGRVSFSLSLVNFFIAFVSQASMVLFPALRQGTDEERRSFYRVVRDALEIAFPIVYLLYFPIAWLISLWLPQYADSMFYFAILLPLCVFETKMDLCCTTYLKVLRGENILLWVNVATVAASALLSLAGIYLAGSIDVVLFGIVTCVIGRSLWCERYLNKKLGVLSSALAFEEIFLTACFIVLALSVPAVPAALVYAVLYGAYIFINRMTSSKLFSLTLRVFGFDGARNS